LIAFKRTLFAIVLLIAGLAVGSAQTSNGTVIGVVSDPAGQALVGATVTATSVDTGAVKTTTTNSEGAYRIESLLPGVYDLSASAIGFETTLQKGLQVPGTSIVTASLVLKVGQATDKIEVSADNAVINTENGQVSGTIGELEISTLPIASLNPYELALTLPGVNPTTQGGFSNGVSYNVGGGRPRANNFLIEGQDNNDAGIQGQGLQPGNDEAVKQVVIIENAYTAEYGHGAGSVSNLIYKSGSNQFHGAVYERLQNSSLDTLDWNNKYSGDFTKAKYRENMPGFRIGGPIKRNKLFFFASYQWDFWRSTADLSWLAIPDAAGMAVLQQYSSNPRVANLLKAYGGLVGDPTTPLGYYNIPLGIGPNTDNDRGSVEVGYVKRNLPAQDNAPELDLKGDYIASSRDTIGLRYIRSSFTAPYDIWNAPGQLPGFDSDQEGVSHNAGITETHTFSANLLNEARVSYGRIGFTFGLPSSTTSNPLYNQPTVSIAGLQGYGIPGGIPQGRFHNTYQLQDTLTWIKGKHTFKYGTDLSNTRVRDAVPFNFYGTIGYNNGPTTADYKGLANYIDDFGGHGSGIAQNFGSPISRPELWSQNYFVTDTWRPIQTLSVDLGFRYEYNGSPFNTPATPYPGIDESNMACFPLTPGAGDCNTKQQSYFQQWGPRAGIAYSPTIWGQNKTVFRAGFGTFYDVVFTNIIDNIQATAPAAASPLISSNTSSRGTANWDQQFANLNKVALPTNTSEPIVNNLKSPRTFHWNLNVEQELPWATTFQVGYVGERGEHLYGNTNLNPYVNDWFSGARVVPTRGSIIVRDNSEDSAYSGLWSELDHKFNHNFLFRASYTFGRAFDDGSEIYTTNTQSSYQFSQYPTPRKTTDWGPSSYDHRQRMVLSYIWTPSVWHTEGSMKILGNIVNRWAVAGITQFQSGTPENVEAGYDVDGDGISNDRPLLANPKAPLATYAFDDSWYYGESDGGLCSGPSLWYTGLPCETVTKNDVHWIIPAYGTHPSSGLVGRNTRYSKGYQQWDMNIQRSFKLHEGVMFDFRGELFNIFNHGEPGVENSTLISGINTDQWSNSGLNTFLNPTPTITGHRHARIFVKISF
jgi:Carboxypeptidase regulatory-like domain/TonB-dependent Receptor Plug Domain